MDNYYCKALKVALEFESEGLSFYRDSIDKTNDPFARKALNFLVKEEEKHIDKIIRFNNYLLGKEEFDLNAECNSKVSERMHKLVSFVVNEPLEKITESSSDIDVYESAMELEKRGYELYEKFSREEKDKRVRQFFSFLVDEEAKHYNLLQNSKRYLEDQSYYFEDAGGWIFG